MAERYLIRDIYCVETDGSDRPKGLTDEDKTGLQTIVLEVLKTGPWSTYELHERVKRTLEREHHARVPAFKGAALFDWTYGCVVRAARAANCEQRWHAPEKR